MAGDRAKRRKWFSIIFLVGISLIATDICTAVAIGLHVINPEPHTVRLIDQLMPPGLTLFLVGAIGFVVNIDRREPPA